MAYNPEEKRIGYRLGCLFAVLEKLQSDANPGQRVVAEKRIAGIMEDINEFPTHLNLEEQGLFAIGYYHQRQALFTKQPKEQASDESEGVEA